MGLQQLPKRKYSAQICHYRRGGNLTIFDKDDDTVERKQLEVLTAKHGRSLRLLCTVGGDQAKLNGVQKSQLALGGGWKLVMNKAVSPSSKTITVIISSLTTRLGPLSDVTG